MFSYITRPDDTVSTAPSLKVGYLFETAFHKPPKETDELLDQDNISEIEKKTIVEEFDRNTELWTNCEVVLAAKVLNAVNPKRHGIKFDTDNQMRRVYDIIFEVLRCKIKISTTILNFTIIVLIYVKLYTNFFLFFQTEQL